MKTFVLALFAALSVFSCPAQSPSANANSDAILGIWHTAGDDTRIRILKSGNQYFGQIIKLRVPNFPAKFGPELAGKPKFDGKNPDLKLRHRPIIGLELMSGFVYAGKNHWDSGKIYDPESGKTYRCKLTLDSPNTLEVRGYIGISLLGRTVIWTR